MKAQIAFYGSTPAYRPVLELHGWGDLQDELNAMTKRGEWDQLANLIDDELVKTFAVVGTPEEAVAEVKRRYGDIATRITPSDPTGPRRRALAGPLRGAARVRESSRATAPAGRRPDGVHRRPRAPAAQSPVVRRARRRADYRRRSGRGRPVAAWATVAVIGKEMPEPEFRRLVDRSEALAALPPPTSRRASSTSS